MFKFTVICFVIAASISIDAFQLTEGQKAKIYGKLVSGGIECMKEYPLSLDHIKTLRAKKMPDDDVAKCFANCLYKRLGLVDDTGKISEKTAHESSRKIFKEGDEALTKIDDLISKCTHVNDEEVGEKGCDRAKLVFECFMKHATELGLDVDF